MNTELLIIFIALNIVNVIIQTVKSLATVKCGKTVASVVNAVAYGLYTVVVVYTVCDLPLWLKVVVVGSCNLVGVFVVKWCEEKARKDKLWKVEATVRTMQEAEEIINLLKDKNIPCNYIDINRYVLINCYCATQRQSAGVKTILDLYHAKYFVSESPVVNVAFSISVDS